MARRTREIDLDDPIQDRGPIDSGASDIGDSGGDSATGGDPVGSGSGYDSGGSGTDANRSTIFGDNGRTGDDPYIRDDAGNVLLDVRGRPRKRRAKRGTGGSRQQKAQAKKVPVDSLARLLAMAHGALSALTKTPELEITDNEARMLATPLSEIFVLYDVQPPPQLMLAMEMTTAASYVYGPKLYMWRERMKEEAEKRKAQQAHNITPRDSQPFEQAKNAIQTIDPGDGVIQQPNYDVYKK